MFPDNDNNNNMYANMQITTTDSFSSSSSSSSSWTRFEDKMFEHLLVKFPEESPGRWDKISDQIPGKSPSTVREHYDALLHDVHQIDSGRVDLPTYADDSSGWEIESSGATAAVSQISFGTRRNKNDSDRKKGTPWTELEHRKFLLGLKCYGKGDWRSISRNFVLTRTPTQVASHAQKYFLRQNSVPKERKRSSIHDITTADNTAIGPPNDLLHQGGSLEYANLDFHQ